MNIARKICTIRQNRFNKNVYRSLRITCSNYESSPSTQPQVQEEKFDFEDLKVLERVQRRQPAIPPFMKNVFVSNFNRELLAYSEILNKEELENVDNRVAALERVFSDPGKTSEDRKDALKAAQIYAAPVNLTNGGLAMNHTESIRYLEVISSDLDLAQEISDHWVALEALKKGLKQEQYQQIVDDLITGEKSIALCIKEKVSERLTQPDFRTSAEMDGNSVWRLSGEKFCQQPNGYMLVLAVVEADRVQGFLVHPNAQGVSSDANFVHFRQTPAIALEHVTEGLLAQILGASRLHAATMSRYSLRAAIQCCADYVRARAFSGKPLSEMPPIRAVIGDALMDVYASESAEYFTAGLMDGYADPDAELEMAMCRNFMANHGIQNVIQLLAIPTLEKEEECKTHLNNMRLLKARGETLDGVNVFIALNGIHHAGKMMAEEIKHIRNPLLNPGFIFKKILQNRHQERGEPPLTLRLCEHLHPSLRPGADRLEHCVLRMRYACETLMGRHGADVQAAYTELTRLAEAATEILVMTAVLARASRSYCIGIRNAEIEMKLASCFVDKTKDKVGRLIKDIDDGEYLNLDHFKIGFGKRLFEDTFAIEKPTSRVFW